jgi:regulator of sigma E protease
MLLSIFAFILVFSVIVLVHEWGHFMAARLAGVQVQEFGLGFPPRIKTLGVRKGVEYTLNAIPFGGFVRLYGETDPDMPGGFASRSAWVRISTYLAGPTMNLVLAAVLLIGMTMVDDQVLVGKVVVQAVAANSPAALAGVQPGDIILEMEGQELQNVGDLVERTRVFLGKEVTLTLLRSDQTVTVHLTPRKQPPAGEGAMGVVIGMQEGYTWKTVRHPIGEAIAIGLRQVWDILVVTVNGFVGLFRAILTPGSLLGPVGIFQAVGEVAHTGVGNLMRFTALISLNLFIFNLIPLPMLDGGQIVSVLLEKLRGGKRIAPRDLEAVYYLGWLLLLSLVLWVTYFDIMRLFSGKSLLP